MRYSVVTDIFGRHRLCIAPMVFSPLFSNPRIVHPHPVVLG
jgi:hypothetical protein